MADEPPTGEVLDEPLVVRTHVTPWGFVVALPLAVMLAYLGAWALDAVPAGGPGGSPADTGLWLFSIPLIGFALFLFLIGIGELARYLKPAVEVVVDESGVTTYGILGGRRIAWGDIVETRVDGRHLSLKARAKGAPRTVRLHFDRLAIEPVKLVERLRLHRPDLKPTQISS
ncbi:MAG: PH domain-containing protein [Hyphomicrobiaceae bacterium]